MKRVIRNSTRSLLIYDLANRLFEQTFGRLTDYLRVQRKVAEYEKITRLLSFSIPDNRVRRGPFNGLRYPTLAATGSALYPKLTGTYEDELHRVLDSLLKNRYDAIIDVGCAEGYYAVGLALRLPGTPVIAFDPDPRARELCREMARCNGVDSNVQIRSFCSPESLAALCHSKRTLVICDCEGFEEHLFTSDFASSYAATDLIIEVHDFIGSPIGERIQKNLESTHAITIFFAETTATKLAKINEPEWRDSPHWLREALVSEGRPPGMYWITALSRTAQG